MILMKLLKYLNMNPQEAKKIEKKVEEILVNHLKNDTVVVGVSGGPDSVFLLHFLKKLPLKIVVAHVNHQVRKKGADLDQKFVESLAKDHIFALKTANVPALSKKSKKGLEETGRLVRYDFFRRLAKKHKAKFILTAHHADDNLETIILNLTRGATLDGLTGMEILTPAKDVSLFRPLLSFSKNQIIDYLRFKKIRFRLDKTNSSQKHTRNRIRLKLIPELKALNPNIALTIAKNTTNLREISDFLKNSALEWIARHALDLKAFRSLEPALQKAILRELHHIHAGNLRDLETTHLDEVIRMIEENVGGKVKKMGRLKIEVKGGKIKINS